jgi:predicted RNase H-like HicB family nuclease
LTRPKPAAKRDKHSAKTAQNTFLLPAVNMPLINGNLVLINDAVIEFFAGEIVMRYSVLLEPINEPEFQGYYYAHIPTLDLTTHGQGIEGAIAAAQELIEASIGEKRSRGESVPIEARSLIAQVEIPDALLRP